MINSHKFENVGIVSYAVYVPPYRIKTEEIAKNWKKQKTEIDPLGVIQKSVSDSDEDCLTMAYEASKKAIEIAGIEPKKIGAVFMGSESFPYAVKPTSTSLANFLGIQNEYFTSDLQFACKAGTTAIQIVSSMVESGMIDYGLAVGSDKSQSRPNDALEFTAASGAAAFVVGKNKNKWIASLKNTISYSSDTLDFWRREKCDFPSHAGRFSGEPSYFKNIESCTRRMFEITKTRPENFDYVVFHSPNKKFPEKAAKKMGFTKKQVRYSLLVEEIGNTYSASSLISLANVLDHSKQDMHILVTSYGSGSGSDSLYLTTQKQIENKRKYKVSGQLKDFVFLSYLDYLKKMNIL